LLGKQPKNHWTDKQNRRQFFVRYAAEQGFDPLVPSHWYKSLYQSKISLTTKKGARGLLRYYDNDCVAALVDCFPNIGLEASKLKLHSV